MLTPRCTNLRDASSGTLSDRYIGMDLFHLSEYRRAEAENGDVRPPAGQRAVTRYADFNGVSQLLLTLPVPR